MMYDSNPFAIPSPNAIAQLFATEEIFHGRTIAWEGVNDLHMAGVQNRETRTQHLRSSLKKEELIAQFEQYKKTAILL